MGIIKIKRTKVVKEMVAEEIRRVIAHETEFIGGTDAVIYGFDAKVLFAESKDAELSCIPSADGGIAVVASYEPYKEGGKEFCGTSEIIAEYDFTTKEKKALKKAIKARKRELARGLRLAF